MSNRTFVFLWYLDFTTVGAGSVGGAGGPSGMPARVPTIVGVHADVLPYWPAYMDTLDIIYKRTNSC